MGSGIISQLVAAKQQREKSAFDAQLGIYKSVYDQALQDPDSVKPGTLEAAAEAIRTLTDSQLGGGGTKGTKGKGGGIGDLFKGMLTMGAYNIYKQQGQRRAATSEAESKASQQMQGFGPVSETDKYQRQLREAAIADKIAAGRARQAAQLKREENQQTYETEYQRLIKSGMPPQRAAEEANAFAAGRAAPSEHAPARPQKQFVELPDGTTALAWIVPGEKGGTLAATGEALPDGWKPAAAPSGADARTTYAQLLRSLHDEHPDWTKDQIANAAGTEFQKKYGVEIGKAEQQIAIREVLSGVGGGDYVPPAPSKPKLTPKTQGATPAAPGATQATPKPTLGQAKAQRESTDQSVYLADLLGNNKASGDEKTRVIRGREIFKQATGLNPVEFEALAASDKGTAKAIIDTVEREASVQRINEVLNQFGDEAINRAKELSEREPDAPILKKPIREITAQTAGNEAYRKFVIAYNGFQRQYSTLTAGAGGLSRAQLPVGIAEKVDHVLDPNATLADVIASVNQVKVEGKRELEGFNQARGDMAKMIALSMQGKSGGQGGGQQSQYKVGDHVKLKDGSTVTIKKINPDGTFDY